jgi:hypothetical protein
MGETKTAARLRRRGLVHTCRIIIQNPARASARPPRCSCGGRNVTVRLWWGGTPIPACRAALVARQPRILSSLGQPHKRSPRVPKLPLPFSTSLVKPASTQGPDFEAEIATLGDHWQDRTIAWMLRHSKAGDTGAPDDKHSPTSRDAKVILCDIGGRAFVRYWRKGFVEPFPAVSARRPALKAKASMCQGRHCEGFDWHDCGKSHSTDDLGETSSECLRPFSRISSTPQCNSII